MSLQLHSITETKVSLQLHSVTETKVSLQLNSVTKAKAPFSVRQACPGWPAEEPAPHQRRPGREEQLPDAGQPLHGRAPEAQSSPPDPHREEPHPHRHWAPAVPCSSLEAHAAEEHLNRWLKFESCWRWTEAVIGFQGMVYTYREDVGPHLFITSWDLLITSWKRWRVCGRAGVVKFDNFTNLIWILSYVVVQFSNGKDICD